MNINITRIRTSNDGTEGRLEVEGTNYHCDTLELPWRNNLKGKSCIIADTYSATVWHSDHFNRDVLRLEDKHGRSDCLVHPANFAGNEDAGEYTQLHGCIAVGHNYGMMKTPSGKMQMGIFESKATMDSLMRTIGPGPHQITIKWIDVK